MPIVKIQMKQKESLRSYSFLLPFITPEFPPQVIINILVATPLQTGSGNIITSILQVIKLSIWEVKFAQGHTAGKWLSWDRKQGEADPKAALLHCLPLSTHSSKQSSIFIHHRKGGSSAWPTASLTSPLSQPNGKSRQAVRAHPAPGTLALLYVFQI